VQSCLSSHCFRESSAGVNNLNLPHFLHAESMRVPPFNSIGQRTNSSELQSETKGGRLMVFELLRPPLAEENRKQCLI
jgi:hypothetical protein